MCGRMIAAACRWKRLGVALPPNYCRTEEREEEKQEMTTRQLTAGSGSARKKSNAGMSRADLVPVFLKQSVRLSRWADEMMRVCYTAMRVVVAVYVYYLTTLEDVACSSWAPTTLSSDIFKQ